MIFCPAIRENVRYLKILAQLDASTSNGTQQTCPRMKLKNLMKTDHVLPTANNN